MLTADDFGDFFKALWARPAFAWQRELVDQVLETRRWPDSIDVPTGLGKTALLDIAVFVASATAHEAGRDRLGRRRTFLIVDRRIVVDQAHERASQLALRLQAASESGDEDDPLAAVAAGLLSFSDAQSASGRVLPVTRMRGGTTWAANWLSRPDLPCLVTGTVDQLGSRLLFRGYGVSEFRRPLDASLVGMDSLILVDEAHLACALTATIQSARRFDNPGLPLPGPTLVELTATPGRRAGQATHAYKLDPASAESDADQTAWRRLNAPKRLFLAEATKTSIERRMAEVAVEAASQGGAPAVLVVCNTVARARAVFEFVSRAARVPSGPVFEADLLIGRSRPVDREALVERLSARFRAGRDRGADEAAAVLVATQTIEVGVDFDADALVTESASWDSLMQRFGRVNRFADQSTTASVTVIHDEVANGPVYGEARDVTWRFLSDVADRDHDPSSGIDISPLACRRLGEEAPKGAWVARREAPLVSQVQLNAWARTSPPPANDAPLDAYLHGFGSASADVFIAWRDGLVLGADPGEEAQENYDDRACRRAMTAMPVHSTEVVEVPIAAARWWLGGQASEVSDVEGVDFDEGPPPRTARQALVKRTSESGQPEWRRCEPWELRPGDTLVVPTTRGGVDAYGWAPDSRDVVRDVAELASVRAQRPVLRLDPGLGQRLGITGEHLERTQAALNQVTELFRSDEQPAQAVATDLAAVVRDALTATNAFKGTAADSGIESPWRPEDVQILIDWLESEPRIVEVLAPDDPLRYQRSLDRLEDAPLVLRGARRWRLETENELLPTADESERTDEDVAGTSTASQRVTLAAHHRNVGNRARSISQALGLDETLATTVYDAARWHDLGKCDDRFQAMLHEGDRLVAEAAPEPLAKSGMPPGDVPRHRQAFIRSGLPVGARHEAWSAALVAAHCEQADYTGDFDLLLHLVASHHGRARPLLPPVTDTASGPLVAEIDGVVVTADLPKAVDWLHPSRFQRLNERYGRWGLALLEAVVRCADMTVSGEGS